MGRWGQSGGVMAERGAGDRPAGQCRRVDQKKNVLADAPPSLKESSVPTPAPSNETVHALRGWRRVVLGPLGLLMRLWGLSLRMDASPDSRAVLSKCDEPVGLVMWHNRLFLASEYVRRFRGDRPIYALVSASSDGAWLDAFFSLVGIRTVRGSSSQGGREAARALIDVLRAGNDIGITPDGPRGPMYDLKPGGLVVTRRARAPMVLIGFAIEDAWQLPSWDRFYLPRPFSRVQLRGELVPAAEQADRQGAIEHLRARMLELNPETLTPTPPVI